MSTAFETDKGAGAHGRAGLIVLQADETLEIELCPLFLDARVALHHTRIPSAPSVTVGTLAMMEADLAPTAALLPKTEPLKVIGYGCTSGATIIGSDVTARLIQSCHPDTPVTDPLRAVIAACKALNVRRLGFLTPYIPEVSAAMRARIEEAGLRISCMESFEQEREDIVARIAQRSTLAALIELGDKPDVDAVFASCTNLPTFDVLRAAETAIDKPVITSNQALAWRMLRLCGRKGPLSGPGRLFSR